MFQLRDTLGGMLCLGHGGMLCLIKGHVGSIVCLIKGQVGGMVVFN